MFVEFYLFYFKYYLNFNNFKEKWCQYKIKMYVIRVSSILMSRKIFYVRKIFKDTFNLFSFITKNKSNKTQTTQTQLRTQTFKTQHHKTSSTYSKSFTSSTQILTLALKSIMAKDKCNIGECNQCSELISFFIIILLLCFE